MSKISLKSSSSGTATFTIESPATNTDRTLVLPDTTAPILAGSGITLSASAPANTLVTTNAGNVGIGTSSPTAPLHVSRSGTGARSRLLLEVTGNEENQDRLVTFKDSGEAESWSIGGDDSGNVFAISKSEELGTDDVLRILPGGDLQFNSGYGSVATAYGCRAWVNFNGTGTVAIRASGNVSSITDRGVGTYTVNLTNAMPDANYSIAVAVVRISGNNTGEIGVSRNVAINTTSFGIEHASSSGNPSDSEFIFAQVFR